MQSSRSLLSVTARCLLAADSAMWAAFAILLWTGVVGVGSVAPAIVGLLAALMAFNAAALGLLAWQVLRGRKLVDFAAVALMVVNVVLSLTDEIGLADLAVFGLSFVVLALLVAAIRISRQAAVRPEPARR